jgi:hypothetical protein
LQTFCCADQAPKVAAQAYGLARGFHGTERGLEIAYASLYPTHQKMKDIVTNLRWLASSSGYLHGESFKNLLQCIFPRIRDIQSVRMDEFPKLSSMGFDPGWTVEIPPTGSVTAPVMTAACASAKHCAKDSRLILGLDMQVRSVQSAFITVFHSIDVTVCAYQQKQMMPFFGNNEKCVVVFQFLYHYYVEPDNDAVANLACDVARPPRSPLSKTARANNVAPVNPIPRNAPSPSGRQYDIQQAIATASPSPTHTDLQLETEKAVKFVATLRTRLRVRLLDVHR